MKINRSKRVWTQPWRKACTAGLIVTAWVFLLQASLVGQTALPLQTPPQQIRMTLLVTDRSNRSAENVRQENIRITEDGQPLTVSFFGKDERPLRCVVALDASQSFQSLLRAGTNVTRALIENKRPDDEMMIVRFVSSDKIEILQEFTKDGSVLLESVKSLSPEGGQSAVIDAVYLAIKAAAARQANNPGVRAVVVLITDGEDRASYYSLDQLVKLLRGTDVQIFTIGVTVRLDKEPGLLRLSAREKAEKLLRSLAAESGAKSFFPSNDVELTEATKWLIQDLTSQYLIGFDRQPKSGEKGLRKVKVSIVNDPQAEKLIAITRPGYVVGPREPIKEEPHQDRKPE
jgi:VWFA-related protein